MMKQSQFPPGWDEARVRRLLEHYESQSDEAAVAEDEAAFEATTHTAMEVPVDLVPAVRELIAKHRAAPNGSRLSVVRYAAPHAANPKKSWG